MLFCCLSKGKQLQADYVSAQQKYFCFLILNFSCLSCLSAHVGARAGASAWAASPGKERRTATCIRSTSKQFPCLAYWNSVRLCMCACSLSFYIRAFWTWSLGLELFLKSNDFFFFGGGGDQVVTNVFFSENCCHLPFLLSLELLWLKALALLKLNLKPFK